MLASLTAIRHPLIALPETWTHANPSPSIFGRSREELYFANYDPELRQHYDDLFRQAADAGCASVDLVSDERDPEYLVWVTLERFHRPAQVRQANAESASRRLDAELPGSKPCGEVIMAKRWGRFVPFAGEHNAN